MISSFIEGQKAFEKMPCIPLGPGALVQGSCLTTASNSAGEIFSFRVLKCRFPVKTHGWPARDSSGVLSPFMFSRRATLEDDIRFKVLYGGIAATMAPSYSFGQPTQCTVVENDNIFILTIKGNTAGDLHLLNPSLIRFLLSALEHVRSRATEGSVLITTADGSENFSQGFDTRYAEEACSNEDYTNRYLEMINLFKKVVAELISFPMPTIAAINGYACGAGLMLALSHDYIKISPERDLLQLTELDTGMTLPDYFAALIRAKVGPGATGRLALRGLKFQARDARDMGIVVEEPRISQMPLDAATSQAESLVENCWDGEVYAETRKSLYPELCQALGLSFTPLLPSIL